MKVVIPYIIAHLLIAFCWFVLSPFQIIEHEVGDTSNVCLPTGFLIIAAEENRSTKIITVIVGHGIIAICLL